MNHNALFNPQTTSLWNMINDLDIFFRDAFDSNMGFAQINQAKFHYPIDIRQSDSGVGIDIAIVGVDKKDVKIEMEEDILRVSYKNDDKLRGDQSKEAGWLHRGITRRSFDFAWKLSSKLDAKKITAEMDKGILSIKIPYSEEKQKRLIDVV